MNYPKVLYKGDHYEDFQEMSRDVHSNKLEHRYVASEEEEIQAMEEGFGPLGDLMRSEPMVEEGIIGTQGAPAIERMHRRGPKAKIA